MTGICYIGIELSARTQQLLLGMEFFTLALFAVVALDQGLHAATRPDSIDPAVLVVQPVRDLIDLTR